MITEEEVINENINEIGKILGIIKSQLHIIDNKGKSRKEVKIDPVEEDIRTVVLHAQRSYLDFYRKIVEFIYDKLRVGVLDDDFFFYIPQLRTLIEIYASLLYLCFQKKERQMTVVIGKTLFTIAKLDYSGQSDEIKKQYDLYFESYRGFIARENLTFPEDMSLFSKKWFDKSGYNYLPIDQILQKEEWITTASPVLTARGGGQQVNPYVIYRHLSNYVHGNVLVKESHGNEKFWVISEVLILSGRMAEMVSVKILNNLQKKDIESWMKRVSISYSKFKDVWLNQSESIAGNRVV